MFETTSTNKPFTKRQELLAGAGLLVVIIAAIVGVAFRADSMTISRDEAPQLCTEQGGVWIDALAIGAEYHTKFVSAQTRSPMFDHSTAFCTTKRSNALNHSLASRVGTMEDPNIEEVIFYWDREAREIVYPNF